MKRGVETSEQSRNTEDPYQLRLMSLLQDLVDDKGRRGAAWALGVDRRTVASSIEAGRLSKRVQKALEVALWTGADPESAKHKERIEALEKRMASLEAEVKAGNVELRRSLEDGLTGLRQDQSGDLEHIERRLAALETAVAAQGPSKQTVRVRNQPTERPVSRQYTEIVTLEPEPDEEQVYGDATPLIVEWRDVRTQVLSSGNSRSGKQAVKRLRELEISLVGEHGLTLPPALHPWDRFQRRDELDRRTRVMGADRVNGLLPIVLKWLRRLFSMGLLGISF